MTDWSTVAQALIGLAILIAVGCFAAAYVQFLRGKYYFEREEGGKRARNLGYLLALLLLLLLGVRIATPWLNPFVADLSHRLAWEGLGRQRARTPPPTVALPTLTPPPSPRAAAASPPPLTPVPPPPSTPTFTPPPTPTSTPSPRPTAQGQHFRALILARGITNDKQPVAEGTAFTLDDRPVYVFFEYQGMTNGVRWGQEWRRGDEVLGREDALWEWGSTGRAWVYFVPPFGWTVGTYEVRLYVEGRLEAAAQFTMK